MAEEKSKKKTNFFKEALKSIKDLDKYEDFALEQPGKSFKYLVKLVLIFCIVICVFYTYQIINNINDIYVDLKERLPYFSYANGIFQVESEEVIIIEEYKDTFGKIIIDTNSSTSETDKYEKNIKNGELGILVLKDKCVILSNSSLGQVTYKYEELANRYNINEFTKQDVINYVEGINIISIYSSIYFVMFIYMFLTYGISILMDVLLLSILAYLVSRISGIRLKFAPSFSIGVHSITLSVILNLIYIIVNLFIGFTIKYFQLMYNTISYIYVIVAILMIKTDFINRQIELMKIAAEQEKIKEEMNKKEEEKKEEKQEEKQEENKQPEKENKDKKEENTNKRKKKNEEEKGVGADAPACQETGK